MKLARRFLSLLLIAVLCFSMIACNNQAGGEAAPSEQSGAADSNQPAETTPAVVDNRTNAERYPIEGSPKLTIGVTKEKMDQSDIFGKWAEVVGVDASYEFYTAEQIPLAFASEDIPDIFFSIRTLSGLTIDQINDYGEAGMLVNFMDHLDKMPNLKKLYEENHKMFNAVMTADGAVYTMPKYGVTLTNYDCSLYYRTDHMKKAGWETPPATIEEFTQFLRDLKTTFGPADPEYYPMIATQADHMEYNNRMSKSLFPAFGELLENDIIVNPDSDTVVAGFTTEQYQRYLKYVKSLMAEGLLDPNCLTAVRDIMNAVQTGDHVTVGTVLAQLSTKQFESGQVEGSSFEPFTSEYVSEKRIAAVGGSDFWAGMISSKCENLDAALAYIDACYSTMEDPLNEEGTVWGVTWYLGELNVAWEWVDEGISYVRTIPEGYESASAYTAANGYSDGPFLSDWFKTEYRDGVPRWLAECIRVHTIPYTVNITRRADIVLNAEEKETVDEYWPDILNYLNQMNAAFLSGEADIDADFDAYLANLDMMGLQEVLDAYQSAYDRK